MNLAEQLNEKFRRTSLPLSAEQLGGSIKITMPTVYTTAGEQITYDTITYNDSIDDFDDIFEAARKVRDYDSDLLNDITSFASDHIAFRNCDYDGHTIIVEKNITGSEKPFHILAHDAENSYQINKDVDLDEIKLAMSDIVPKIEDFVTQLTPEDVQLDEQSLKL